MIFGSTLQVSISFYYIWLTLSATVICSGYLHPSLTPTAEDRSLCPEKSGLTLTQIPHSQVQRPWLQQNHLRHQKWWFLAQYPNWGWVSRSGVERPGKWTFNLHIPTTYVINSPAGGLRTFWETLFSPHWRTWTSSVTLASEKFLLYKHGPLLCVPYGYISWVPTVCKAVCQRLWEIK